MNSYGVYCAVPYSWCAEEGLAPGHIAGISPAALVPWCETFDFVECGDGIEITIGVGPDRAGTCGF